jgi:choline transport protein
VCEEVHNASTVVPWAIISTIMVNGVMGLALLIAVLFCLGDLDAALNTPTGIPFIEILNQATNSKAGATVLASLVLFLFTAGSSGTMATASRLLWSFARDNGVPFSAYIKRVSFAKTQLLPSCISRDVEN